MGNQRNFIKEQRSFMLSNKLVQLLNRLARVSDGEARQAVIARRQEVSIAFAVFDGTAISFPGEETLAVTAPWSGEEVGRVPLGGAEATATSGSTAARKASVEDERLPW